MTTYYTGIILYFIFYNLSNVLSCVFSTFIIFDALKKIYTLFFESASTFFIRWILIAYKNSQIPNVTIQKY